MSGSPGLPLTLAAAAAGGLAAAGAREAVLATPALAAWVRLALEPLGRAGREGEVNSVKERRRLPRVRNRRRCGATRTTSASCSATACAP